MDQDTYKRNLSDTFRPDPTSTSFKRPTAEMNVASGCPLFATQSVVEGSTYLKDDTIFIKVTVETADLPSHWETDTVEPLLSNLLGGVLIRSDNRKVI